ncbi:integrase [Pandoraea sputorum]|uniref:Integrase n=1 Tax=Pandoraea sputorum TaxID=93222 RepID=A0A5E5BEM8_9BURK|nr:integrase [Pandoraea sputorum]
MPLLRNAPHLMGITVLRQRQENHPDRYPDNMRRTLARRIRQWRALEGPTQEGIFPQAPQPGVRGLSDFTDMSKLCVTIGGAPFAPSAVSLRGLPCSRGASANGVKGASVSTPSRPERRTRSGRRAAVPANIALRACRPPLRT